MKQFRHLSFTGATQGLRSHRGEQTLPAMQEITNCYVSTSDGALVLRPDLQRFRDDLHAIGERYQAGTGITKRACINTIISSDSPDRHAYIMNLGTTAIGQELTSSTITEGTVSVSSTTVTRTGGGSLLQRVWPGCLIEFAGSTNLYRIAKVTSDATLQLDDGAVPGTLSDVTYTIYRVHDAERARYPVHVERFNRQFIYCASSPDTQPSDTISGPFTSDGEFFTSEVTTTTRTSRTSWKQSGLGESSFTSFGYVEYMNDSWLAIDAAWPAGIYTSSNRFAWTKVGEFVPSTGQGTPRRIKIIYGAGVYVAVDRNGSQVFWTSTDLRTWSSVSCAAGSLHPTGFWIISDAVFGGGKFVLVGRTNVYTTSQVGDHAGIVTSADGSTWTPVDTTSLLNVRPLVAISYTNSKYVAFGNGGTWGHSTDAATWTAVASVQWNGFPEVASIPGPTYVFVFNKTYKAEATVYSSPDLTTWTLRTLAVGDANPHVVSDGTTFVIQGNGYIQTSANGITWTQRRNAGLLDVAVHGTDFVAVGTSALLFSDDGITWSDGSSPVYAFHAIAIKPGDQDVGEKDTIVAVGDLGGYAYVSSGESGNNGATFSICQLPVTDTLNDIASSGYGFVAVGANGAIITSANGANWVKQTSGTTADLNGVCYDSTLDLFVAVGQVKTGHAVILTSPDTVTWTSRTSGEAVYDLNGVAGNGTYLLAVGRGGVILRSADGVTWEHLMPQVTRNKELLSTGDVRINWRVRWDGTYFCIVGNDGKIVRSTDSTYTPAATGEDGDAGDAFSAWVVSGMTVANTGDFPGKLLVEFDYAGGTQTVNLYSVVSSINTLVASGSRTYDGLSGTITLAEQGGSGISGSVLKSAAETASIAVGVITIYASWEEPSNVADTSFDALLDVSTNVDKNSYLATCGGASCVIYLLDNSSGFQFSFNPDTPWGMYYGIPDGQVYRGIAYGPSSGRFYVCTQQGVIGSVSMDTGGITTTTTTTESVLGKWVPLSETLRAAAFAVVGGYVLLGNMNEFSTTWTHYGQRIRWTSPGTYNDFQGEGAGYSDLYGLGVGDIRDMRTVGSNVVILHDNAVSVLYPTGDVELPFEGRIIRDRITAISNLLSMDDIVLFVASDGMLYQANGTSCAPIVSQFDVTPFSDFNPSLVTQLVWDTALKVVLVFQPDASGTKRVYTVNPASWSVSSFVLPSAGEDFYAVEQVPLSIVQSISAYGIGVPSPQRETPT